MTQEQSFQLPDLGEGLADAELLSWAVAVGDVVTLNQVIAEVETAKAAVELPSPYAGRVLALLVAEGETVQVGTPIITFDVNSAAGVESAADQRVPVLVGYGATAGVSSRRNARPSSPPAPMLAAAPAPAPAFAPAPEPGPAAVPDPARPLAKPLVRKLAKDLGVDLTALHGTGAGGVITRDDVLTHSQHPSVGGRDEGREEREERVPIRGVRKATAAAMVRSAFTAPHVTEFITLDVTPTMDLLHRLRASTFTDGVRLTMTAFVATALLQALRRHPELNSSWDDATQEIVLKRYVNLGIATATPRGLLVPNLKDADRLGLIELARALDTLTSTARDGRCTLSDLAGGTISLTNVGVFGVDTGTPILNPGEAAILCLGAVREQPWVHEGALAVRWVTTLSLSFDHRLVDGEQGSRFLADVAAILTAG